MVFQPSSKPPRNQHIPPKVSLFPGICPFVILPLLPSSPASAPSKQLRWELETAWYGSPERCNNHLTISKRHFDLLQFIIRVMLRMLRSHLRCVRGAASHTLWVLLVIPRLERCRGMCI